MKKRPFKDTRKGQAMLLAVLTLGGTMLGVTTIAGLLMLYQIRQATDFTYSAQALFAADAGTEWALYEFFHSIQPLPGSPAGTFSNGATLVATCENQALAAVACNTANAYYVLSRGGSGNTRRAFQVTLPTNLGATP